MHTLPPAGVENQTYVSNLYLTLLDRQPDTQGLNYYSGLLDAGGVSREEIVREITAGSEYHRDVVEEMYRTYLHRDADPGGLSTYMSFLGNGGSIETLREILLSSKEYYVGRGGSTNDGYLAALYQDVFGRAPDAVGLAGYQKLLTTGFSRGAVARAFIISQEGSQDRVQQIYQSLLVRPAESGGLEAYSAILMHGGSEDQIVVALAGSPEMWAQPARQ